MAELPAELSMLRQLRVLWLEDNRLTEIPDVGRGAVARAQPLVEGR